MKMRSLGLLALVALAGCGMAGKVVAPMAGTRGVGAVQPMPQDGPEVQVTLSARNITFPMRVLDVEGADTIWVAADGAQMETRGGLVTATRGFGIDLTAAVVPAAATLSGGAVGYGRAYDYLDGTDTLSRATTTCAAQAVADPGNGPAGSRHVVEACLTASGGSITNEFWFGSKGKLLQSRQWVSKGVGYVTIVAR